MTHSDLLASRDVGDDVKSRSIERHGCPGEPHMALPELCGDWRWKLLQCGQCGDAIAICEARPERTYTLAPETARLCLERAR